jgi:hypothetical protein
MGVLLCNENVLQLIFAANGYSLSVPYRKLIVYYGRCFTYSFYQTVLWIRICFDADPDPAFYLNADPDPGSQINAVPSGSGSLSDLAVRKIAFLHEKYALLM